MVWNLSSAPGGASGAGRCCGQGAEGPAWAPGRCARRLLLWARTGERVGPWAEAGPWGPPSVPPMHLAGLTHLEWAGLPQYWERGWGDVETESCLVPGLEKNLVSHPPYTEGKNRQEEELSPRPLAPARAGAGAGAEAGGRLCSGAPAPQHFTGPQGGRWAVFPIILVLVRPAPPPPL